MLSFALASCAAPDAARLASQLQKNVCRKQEPFRYAKSDLPKPLHLLELDTALTHRFSFRSLNVAHAIGVLERLSEFVRAKNAYQAHPTLEKRLEVIELSGKIRESISLSSLEISAIASEMDCEEERADQVAAFLKGKEDERQTALTVGAIVVGAAGAIAAGILLASGDSSNAPELIGIGAALAEATLGAMILLSKTRIEFYHARNALRDIWTAPETSNIFPASVWYYLTYRHPNQNEKSLREQLVATWQEFEPIDDFNELDKENFYALFFGDGGDYTADQLASRANMYDQIESYINLMKQDLKTLASEFEKMSQ